MINNIAELTCCKTKSVTDSVFFVCTDFLCSFRNKQTPENRGLRELQIQLLAKLLEFVCNELYLRSDNDLDRVLCRAENTLDA